MKPQVISFHCVLKDKIGNLISSTFNKDVITNFPGDSLPALSKGLQNLKAGEKRQIFLPASQAYGFYDFHLIIEIQRKKLPYGKELKVGDTVSLPTQDKKMMNFRVIQGSRKSVTLDGNHPLAGKDLIFYVEGVQVRDATREEVEQCRLENFSRRYH